MAQFNIQHITRYTYENAVRDSANMIMLYPIEDEHQEVVLHTISVTGNPSIALHQDVFSNTVGTFTHSKSHDELVIDSRLQVKTKVKELPQDNEQAGKQWKELDDLKFQIPFFDFLRIENTDVLPEIHRIIGESETNVSGTPLQSAVEFCQYVNTNFTYRKGVTTVETTLGEIWNLKSGVCQDFAHMLLMILRLKKIPARYVSGYICPNKNGMRGEGATHAWVEAFIPFYGWLGLDPTNNCIANENHVRLAVGKNFTDCSPVRGTYRGTSNHTLEVVVTVSYEGSLKPGQPVSEVMPITSVSKNSYQRHHEMQMQQQQ
jgi:transglutaminase-like putative cysteine protease